MVIQASPPPHQEPPGRSQRAGARLQRAPRLAVAFVAAQVVLSLASAIAFVATRDLPPDDGELASLDIR